MCGDAARGDDEDDPRPLTAAELAELDGRYYARMAEIVQPRPGRLRRPHWFRESWSNLYGTGVYHADPECFAINQVIEGDAQVGAQIYELDVAAGAAWEWRRTYPTRHEPSRLKAGWYRLSEAPYYSPGDDPEEVALLLEEGVDPISALFDREPNRHLAFDVDEWRPCRRCGGTSAPVVAACPTCWLVPGGCED